MKVIKRALALARIRLILNAARRFAAFSRMRCVAAFLGAVTAFVGLPYALVERLAHFNLLGLHDYMFKVLALDAHGPFEWTVGLALIIGGLVGFADLLHRFIKVSVSMRGQAEAAFAWIRQILTSVYRSPKFQSGVESELARLKNEVDADRERIDQILRSLRCETLPAEDTVEIIPPPMVPDQLSDHALSPERDAPLSVVQASNIENLTIVLQVKR